MNKNKDPQIIEFINRIEMLNDRRREEFLIFLLKIVGEDSKLTNKEYCKND